MNGYDELRALAQVQDPSLVEKIKEYEQLRTLFVELTERDDADESFLIDILVIPDRDRRIKANKTAQRMRYLARFVCSRLHY